jgi:hypothetical protein
MVVALGYRGSRGVHVIGFEDPNLALPVNFFNRAEGQPWLFSASPSRLNPNFDAYTYKQTGNDSFYHAFSIRAEKRFANGLQFQSHYTFSKTIDDASTSKGGGNDGPGGIGVAQKLSWYDKRADRAVSPFDLTHSFTISYSYQLPFGRSASGFKAAALGGWDISGITTWSSGPPITITQGTSTASTKNTGILGGSRRPDLVAGRTKDDIISGTSSGCAAFPSYAGRKLGTADLYYDPCAFSFVDLTNVGGVNYLYWGNVGRNTLRGAGFFNVDFSVHKDWKLPVISEAFGLQFRGELYNIFNHPNLGVPSGSIANGTGTPSTSAGQINSTFNSSRQIQLGIKAVF